MCPTCHMNSYQGHTQPHDSSHARPRTRTATMLDRWSPVPRRHSMTLRLQCMNQGEPPLAGSDRELPCDVRDDIKRARTNGLLQAFPMYPPFQGYHG